MSNTIKILFSAILIALVFNQDEICQHLGFGQAKLHDATMVAAPKIKKNKSPEKDLQKEDFINDTIYRWDEYLYDWVIANDLPELDAQFINLTTNNQILSEPIVIDWKILMDIKYRLRYFSEFGIEMHAPVFPKAVQELHEKEVIIEGFVIPFDEEEELLSLSFNPYSSCFFCGKGSPASVVSMYLKKKRKRYKIDDYKKFRGILHLNVDDPNEFYYILRDAQEE